MAEREVPSGGTSATVGTQHFIQQDHLGSTSLQTTASGQYEGHEFRAPFGQPWASGGSLSTDLQYTGQRSYEGGAASLGSLLDYGARSYSPVLGKFLQADTIVPSAGDPQSLNRYAYTRNNPLKFVDPTGHAEQCEDEDSCGDGSAGGGDTVTQDTGNCNGCGTVAADPCICPIIDWIEQTLDKLFGPDPDYPARGGQTSQGDATATAQQADTASKSVDESDKRDQEDGRDPTIQQEKPKVVILDTSAVYAFRSAAVQAAIGGNRPVMTDTTAHELAENVTKNGIQVPGYVKAGVIPRISDVEDQSVRNRLSEIWQEKGCNLNAPGTQNDLTIAVTAIKTENSRVITGDRRQYEVLLAYGYSNVVYIRPGG